MKVIRLPGGTTAWVSSFSWPLTTRTASPLLRAVVRKLRVAASDAPFTSTVTVSDARSTDQAETPAGALLSALASSWALMRSSSPSPRSGTRARRPAARTSSAASASAALTTSEPSWAKKAPSVSTRSFRSSANRSRWSASRSSRSAAAFSLTPRVVASAFSISGWYAGADAGADAGAEDSPVVPAYAPVATPADRRAPTEAATMYLRVFFFPCFTRILPLRGRASRQWGGWPHRAWGSAVCSMDTARRR
ncbi:hypothetical protein SCALM49S_04943 [Streptomyces californicus]